jgi:hypothetical protein
MKKITTLLFLILVTGLSAQNNYVSDANDGYNYSIRVMIGADPNEYKTVIIRDTMSFVPMTDTADFRNCDTVIFPPNVLAALTGTNGTNGTNGSDGASFDIQAPSAGNSITSGTAFQPRSGGPCMITVNSSLTGALGLTGNVTIAMSATQNGTYTTVVTDAVTISVLGLVADKSSGTIPVKAGWWVKVTYTGATPPTGTYTKWDL